MARKTWFSAISFTLAVAIIGILLAAFARGRFSWASPEVPKAQCEALAAATAAPTVKAPVSLVYQDRVASAVIREPQNTWSNLAFVLVGALIWVHDRRSLARLLGAALVALGIASGLYHASLLPSWRGADVATMGWVSVALCCHGYDSMRQRPASDGKAGLWIGVIGSVFAIMAAFFRNDVRFAGMKPFDTSYTTIAGITGIFVLALLGIVRAIRVRPHVRFPALRLSILASVVAAAIICQLNDRVGRCFCAPESMVQAHAVWHVLMAVAVALAYDLFALIEGRSGFGPVVS
jgi:hypothetical protein